MKWHELNVASRPSRKRVGGGVRQGFEGGQNPLAQRLPKKRGFTSLRPATQIVHTDQLNNWAEDEVSPASLHKAGLIHDPKLPVKLLLRGELKSKLSVNNVALSKTAKAAISSAGGKIGTVASTASKVKNR
jgi:large subunit ribosomal protein L15